MDLRTPTRPNLFGEESVFKYNSVRSRKSLRYPKYLDVDHEIKSVCAHFDSVGLLYLCICTRRFQSVCE